MTRSLYVSLALATALLPSVAAAQGVVRHANTPPGLILESVTLPPETETLILSGQLPDPIDPAVKPDSIASYGDTKTQTISTFAKIKTIVESKGYTMSDIVKLTVFVMGDPKLGGKMDFAGMNEGFRQFFGTADNPETVARSTIQVAGLAGPYFLVEIEAIAARVPPAP